MKRLVLRRFPGGEFAVWDMPAPGAQYIVSCDPSLGRSHTEGGDHSAIGVWRRWPGRVIEQVAEWHGKWPIGRVGEVIACLSRAYGGILGADGREIGNAIVNIERNLMDTAKWSMVEGQEFPLEFLFVPRNERNIKEAEAKVYFTIKDERSEHYLINTLIDYLDRKAVLIRSKETVDELRSLEKTNSGRTPTNGKDRSVMTIMAVVADQELPSVEDFEDKPPEPVPDCPAGVDRELWAKKHEKPKPRMPRVSSWTSAAFRG